MISARNGSPVYPQNEQTSATIASPIYADLPLVALVRSCFQILRLLRRRHPVPDRRAMSVSKDVVCFGKEEEHDVACNDAEQYTVASAAADKSDGE
jgi:hypothetical protein